MTDPGYDVEAAAARCEKTDHPVGTDTVMLGGGCKCNACRAYRAGRREGLLRAAEIADRAPDRLNPCYVAEAIRREAGEEVK